MKALCEIHRKINAGGFCPICLLNELDELRRDNERLRRENVALDAVAEQWRTEFGMGLDEIRKLRTTVAAFERLAILIRSLNP